MKLHVKEDFATKRKVIWAIAMSVVLCLPVLGVAAHESHNAQALAIEMAQYPHQCIAQPRNHAQAIVHCDFQEARRKRTENLHVPMDWVALHFEHHLNGSWTSGG